MSHLRIQLADGLCARRVALSICMLAFHSSVSAQVPEPDDRSPPGLAPRNDGLGWSTYFGGSLQDATQAVVRDIDGSLFVAGWSFSPDLPVTPDAYDGVYAISGASTEADAFIAHLSNSGELLACTYLGGSKTEFKLDLAIAPDGSIVCAGVTTSPDFPTTPGALAPSQGLLGDFFISHFTRDLGTLLNSTVIGGRGFEGPGTDSVDVAVAANGDVILTGFTISADMPTTLGAYDTSFGGIGDCWIGRLSGDLSSLIWGSFLGGSGECAPKALAIDADGTLVVAGRALAAGFPQTVAPWPLALSTTNQLFIARFSADGSELLHSGFIMSNYEVIQALCIDSAGQVFLGGGTISDAFPVTPGTYDTTPNSLFIDGFILCLAPDLNSIVRSTFVGVATNAVEVLAIDASGCPTYVTVTTSGGFVGTPGALLPSQFPPQCNTYIVGRLDPTFEHLLYATYLGGEFDESPASGIAVGPKGELLFAGTTDSINFPVTRGAFQPEYAGGIQDVTVSNLTMLPTGVKAIGDSTPGCLGPLAAGATNWPSIDMAQIGLTCTAAPPLSSQGLLAISLRPLQTPLMVSGVAVWVAPHAMLALVPVTSGETGFAREELRIPQNPASLGLHAAVQFFWKDACGPSGLSASNALEITIQP